MCMCVSKCLYAHPMVCVPYMCRSPQRSEEGFQSSGTGVAGGDELPCGRWEPNLGPLKEQYALLNSWAISPVSISAGFLGKSENS